MKKQTNKLLTIAAIATGLLFIKNRSISGVRGCWSHGEVEDLRELYHHPDGTIQYLVKVRLDNGVPYEAITLSNSRVNRKLLFPWGKKGMFDIRFAKKCFVLYDIIWDS